MALMNEGLFLCQLAADKSGADVMKLPPHNINLGSALGAGSSRACRSPSRWLTYSLLVLHDVIPAVLLGEVRRQHVEPSPELGEHHVIGVTYRCRGEELRRDFQRERCFGREKTAYFGWTLNRQWAPRFLARQEHGIEAATSPCL